MLTLIHRPGCSKSRCLYTYLTDQQIQFTVRDYMNDPLSETELKRLLEQLSLPAKDLIRTTDPLFASFQDSIDLQDESAVIKLLCLHPALLQRPVLYDGNSAVIGRPFEKAVDFLQQPRG